MIGLTRIAYDWADKAIIAHSLVAFPPSLALGRSVPFRALLLPASPAPTSSIDSIAHPRRQRVPGGPAFVSDRSKSSIESIVVVSNHRRRRIEDPRGRCRYVHFDIRSRLTRPASELFWGMSEPRAWQEDTATPKWFRSDSLRVPWT